MGDDKQGRAADKERWVACLSRPEAGLGMYQSCPEIALLRLLRGCAGGAEPGECSANRQVNDRYMPARRYAPLRHVSTRGENEEWLANLTPTCP